MIVEVKDFDREVLQQSYQRPVVVDFWAAWCGPCRMIGPILERLAQEAQGKWILAKVNTDEHPDVAARYGIMSIPAIKMFYEGKVIDEFVGALPESEVRRWLAKALPSPHAALVTQAEQALEQGQADKAKELLEQVVQEEPQNEKARLLLARAVLGTDPARAKDLAADVSILSDYGDQAEAIKTLAEILQEAQKLPSDGSALDRLFKQGAEAIAKADWDTALQSWIAVLEKDRHYREGLAKDGCRAIFALFGLRHPLAEKYHRAFSSALHS